MNEERKYVMMNGRKVPVYTFDTLKEDLANAEARIAELEAERDALRSRFEAVARVAEALRREGLDTYYGSPHAQDALLDAAGRVLAALGVDEYVAEHSTQGGTMEVALKGTTDARFTNQHPFMVREEHLKWWPKTLRCFLCGHKFELSEVARWVYCNSTPDTAGNCFTCTECDGIDILTRIQAHVAESKVRFWWLWFQEEY